MIVYEIDSNIYINLTNKCSNACEFCVRTTSDEYMPYDLWLKKEPAAEDVIKEIKEKYMNHSDFVFCGYGEPLYRLNEIIEVAKFLKANGKNTRLNTNGQASLIVGDGVAEKLKGLIDRVSISLNSYDAKTYNEICHCQFGDDGFYSLLEFAKECKDQGINVNFSVVRAEGVDVDKTVALANSLQIPIRIRELIK